MKFSSNSYNLHKTQKLIKQNKLLYLYILNKPKFEFENLHKSKMINKLIKKTVAKSSLCLLNSFISNNVFISSKVDKLASLLITDGYYVLNGIIINNKHYTGEDLKKVTTLDFKSVIKQTIVLHSRTIGTLNSIVVTKNRNNVI